MSDLKGDGLLRRMTHGPDPKVLLREALIGAGGQIGVGVAVKIGSGDLTLPDP